MSKRVLLVDDSDFVLAKLRSVVEAGGELEVVATAGHGLAALEMAQALRPDLVTLDVRMPVMDGVGCLKHLMVRRPVPVVMISAFTTADSHLTFDCLRFGAVDFLTKPRAGEGGVQGAEEIRLRLQRAANVDRGRIRYRRLALKEDTMFHSSPPGLPTGLLVFSGGRSGLAEILSLVNALPPELGLGVVIDLEQPAPVVASFAAYISRFSAYRVCWENGISTRAVSPPEDHSACPPPACPPSGEPSTCPPPGDHSACPPPGDHSACPPPGDHSACPPPGEPRPLRAGEIRLLSSEDPHLLVDDGEGAALHRVPEVAGAVSPRKRSGRLVESLFESVAEVFGPRSFGVLVSGARQGAARGLGHLTRAGGTAFVQDPGSAPAHSALDSALRQDASRVGEATGWAAILAARLRGSRS